MLTAKEEQRLDSTVEPADAQQVMKTTPLGEQYLALLDDKNSAALSPAKEARPEKKSVQANPQASGQAPEQSPAEDLSAFGTRLIAPPDADKVIRVSVVVQSKASEKEMDKTIEQITEGKRKPLTDTQYNAQFGADPSAMARVLELAKSGHLTVENEDSRSGRVELEGTIKNVDAAYSVFLQDQKDVGSVIKEEVASVVVPAKVSDTKAASGAGGPDGSPAGTHTYDGDPEDNPADGPVIPPPPGSLMPNEVASMYKFPQESMGAGQSVGIIELAGGLDQKDNAQYYKDHNLKLPKIQEVDVDGAKSLLGTGADGEVALDSQIIGAVAPDANQQLIYAPNGDLGFSDAITRATFPEKGEPQNSAISISWGFSEPQWTAQTLKAMHLAFKKAALKGISVFASTGDKGAHNDSADGSYSTMYPAADPLVTATGGSDLDSTGKEVAWNDSNAVLPGGITGGGISERFDLPDFQKGLQLPADANKTGRIGRGVPDIVGHASQDSGYIVRFGGREKALDGTSCTAALYAALMMRVNGALGHPVGDLNPFLYKHANSGMFHKITQGDNDGYEAGPGWNAVSGLGSIRGDEFLKELRQDNR